MRHILAWLFLWTLVLSCALAAEAGVCPPPPTAGTPVDATSGFLTACIEPDPTAPGTTTSCTNTFTGQDGFSVTAQLIAPQEGVEFQVKVPTGIYGQNGTASGVCQNAVGDKGPAGTLSNITYPPFPKPGAWIWVTK